MIVADTNLIASFWVPNNMEQLAYQSLKKDPEWIAPLLWVSEFRNVLSLYYRKKILDLSSIYQAIDEAEELMGTRECSINSKQVLTLMSESTCSAYDCEFVALASDFDIQLVTFDKKILSEFSAIAIHPDDFVAG
ncbi:type II toxin-antitoxin system VapC family toxin [Natronogracilivirga saccharolytica]|uniref:Type II toxin-antitoxin system VapC family toxin n=1 Tax=Natronogracilivirga saccharolytica TaxID=2812953 RepID=A0A8J7UVF2_9BACT|nr:type II toxin-antitoxin system VapC family toxin [Natronogracilivirga saccharolytica]MBP3193385.1 type II toxin-antitoxin system VapC family toxin [Natronogracilivirga saccharolytica]